MTNDLPNHGGLRKAASILAVALLASGLAGCGASKKTGVASASTVAPAQNDESWGMERVKEAIALLNEGQSVAAREKLMKALKAQPGDMLARNLLAQIDTDPKVLLGSESYAYTVKEGDSMSALALRFLGDPMKSYALARYNGLASPMALKPGQAIQIPGKRKVVAPVVAKKAPPAVKKAAPAPKVAQAPAKPSQPAANPRQAAKLRGQGLAAMNGGAINRAVLLLRQALSFDPGNGLIRSDLARALRIQGTLKGRP